MFPHMSNHTLRRSECSVHSDCLYATGIENKKSVCDYPLRPQLERPPGKQRPRTKQTTRARGACGNHQPTGAGDACGRNKPTGAGGACGRDKPAEAGGACGKNEAARAGGARGGYTPAQTGAPAASGRRTTERAGGVHTTHEPAWRRQLPNKT